MKTSVRTLNQNSTASIQRRPPVCQEGCGLPGTEMRHSPWVPALCLPLSHKGNRLIVVADVEERAVLPVDAELEGRGAGKEEKTVLSVVPSSDVEHCPKAQVSSGT